MVRLYLDEDVSLHIAPDLEHAGHDVLTTHGARHLGAGDHEQLLFAAKQRRSLVTSNRRDFSLLHLAWHMWAVAWEVDSSHSGILILGQEAREQSADLVVAFLSRNLPLTNQAYRWRPFDGWSRLNLDGRWAAAP